MQGQGGMNSETKFGTLVVAAIALEMVSVVAIHTLLVAPYEVVRTSAVATVQTLQTTSQFEAVLAFAASLLLLYAICEYLYGDDVIGVAR